jgi:hypothetical protein
MLTAEVVVRQSNRADINVFKLKPAILAKYARLVAMVPMVNRSIASRSVV